MALGNLGKYSQMLQNMPNPNTGTHAGGLSHVLQQALLGYSAGQAQRAEEATQGRLTEALKAMTGTPDNTITWNQPTRPDGTGDPTTLIPGEAPNRPLAIQLMADDPNLAPMAFDMANQDYALQNAPTKPTTANQTGSFVDAQGNTVFGTYDEALANGWTEMPKQTAPKTVNTAEGVFVLNPDGTLGDRIGSPVNSGTTVEVNNLPPLAETPGFVEADKKFAADIYVPFVMAGGFADAEKGMGQLEEVVGRLDAVVSGESDADLSGTMFAALSMFGEDATAAINPEAVDTKQLVEEVVQRNLRLILGAQFTQNEGAALIARAYNPALEEAQNAERLRRLLKSMQDAYAAKVGAAQYFQNNGTLAGYETNALFMSNAGTLAMLEAALDSGGAVPSDGPPSVTDPASAAADAFLFGGE